MKKTIFLTILFLIVKTGISIAQTNYEHLYKTKIKVYTAMKYTGFTLATVGGITAITGYVLMKNEDFDVVKGNGSLTYEANVFLTGVGLFIPGMIFSFMGNHKVKYYREKLENLNVGLNLSSEQKGIMLTYRF